MRHPFVLLFVLSAHTLALLAALRPDVLSRIAAATHPAPPRLETPVPAPAAVSTPPQAAPASPRASPPLPGEPAALDIGAWLARQARAREQYRQRHFGPAIAALLRQGDGGLDALAERARHGDAAALEAWGLRVDECQSVDHPPAGVLAATSRERAPASQPDPRRAFADAVLQARRDADAELALTCAKANTDRATLEAAWRDLADAPTPAARQARAELQYDDDGDLAALLRRLRELLRGAPDPALQRSLAEHLVDSAEAAEREEGLALLRRLAPTDPDALSQLAQCLGIGCGALAPRPDEVGDLVAQSAELGYAWALEREIADAARQGRPLEAMAWSRYRQWLNAQGCFAAPSDLSLRFLLADTQLEETLGARLGAAQSVAADTRAVQRVQRAGAAARRRADCD